MPSLFRAANCLCVGQLLTEQIIRGKEATHKEVTSDFLNLKCDVLRCCRKWPAVTELDSLGLKKTVLSSAGFYFTLAVLFMAFNLF